MGSRYIYAHIYLLARNFYKKSSKLGCRFTSKSFCEGYKESPGTKWKNGRYMAGLIRLFRGQPENLLGEKSTVTIAMEDSWLSWYVAIVIS